MQVIFQMIYSHMMENIEKVNSASDPDAKVHEESKRLNDL